MYTNKLSALLTLNDAMQHLYHFCAILGDGQHVDLRPRFSFTTVENDRTTATVTLPTSVDAKIRQHRGTGAWITERAARKDAAFQAYVALHKAGLVNDNLLPLLSDPDEEPDFGVVDKRPAILKVGLLLDPWVPVAQTISATTTSMLWYRTKLSFSLNEQTVSLVLLLPRPTLRVPDFLLHWNEEIRYVLTSEPLDAINLSQSEMAVLQRDTRALLHSIYGSRMTEERYDFLFLLGSYDASSNGNKKHGPLEHDRRPALEVYADIRAGLNPTIGLVRQRGVEGHLLMFRGFQPVDVDMLDNGVTESGTEPMIQIIVSAFPKRRDFLHYVRDVAQHRMYSKEYMLPAKEFLIDRSPASYAIFAAFIPSILHRYELFMIVQELCDSAIKYIGFTDHELVLRAITASSTNENDYQRLEFLGDCILKFSTAVQLMAENLHWPESYLTEKKDRIVSNGSLAKASRRAGLDRFIITKAFTGTKWRPRYVNDILASAVAELPEGRDLSTKTLADIVESLIGAAYVEGGMLKAHLCIANLLPKLSWRSIDQSRDVLAQHAAEAHSSSAPIHLERVEKLVGYTFKNKYLLLEALTHPSFVSYRDGATTSYQRLEFLGDAVLDYLVSRRLYAYRKPISSNGAQGIPPRGYAPDELPHWTMHSIRASIVNASFLAFLCMEACILEPRTEVIFTSPENPSTTTEHGDLSSTTGVPAAAPLGEPTPVQGPPVRKALWQFMRHSAPSLQAASAAAAARHEGNRDDIWEALRTSRRYPWHLLAKVGAEKFFSDIIEAVLGAIFIDSTEAEKQDPQVADDRDLKASEEFLDRLGLMDVLDRFLRDGVDCLHPKTALGRLAFSEKIGWEWDEVEASDAGRIDGTIRCRVSVGERWIGDWVEGHSRLEAETAAADRAVLILLGEGRKWKGMDEINGVIATGEDGETAGTGVVGFEEEDEEEVDQAVVGAEAQREDLVMRDA